MNEELLFMARVGKGQEMAVAFEAASDRFCELWEREFGGLEIGWGR